MDSYSLTDLAAEHLGQARSSPSGRSATTLYGGHEHHLRQTLLALAADNRLDDHEAPGEATLQVLHGRVRMVTQSGASWNGREGDLLTIPDERHDLSALEDAVVLLTVSVPL